MKGNIEIKPHSFFIDTRITCAAHSCEFYNHHEKCCSLKSTFITTTGKCVNFKKEDIKGK